MGKNYIVYMHIFPSKKVYIGITSQKPYRRWNNGNGYKNNDYMMNAIKKYGWENIEHKILYKGLLKEEAELIEKKLILKYSSNNRKNGYNILEGGNASNTTSKETREKMSKNMKKLWGNKEYKEHMIEMHKGKKVTSETKKKMSKSNNRYWKGKHLSDEIKEKISKSRKNKTAWNKGTKGIMKPNRTSFKNGEIHSITKRVECVETKIIYETINSASRELGINATSIINVCKGKQKIAGGYHWRYV